MRAFGASPADVVTDSTGAVVGGVQLRVYTAITGGQRVTELYDPTGTPLPGVVTSLDTGNDKGRYQFQAPDEYYSLYMDRGYGDRWQVVPADLGPTMSQAVTRSQTALTTAEDALARTVGSAQEAWVNAALPVFRVTAYGAKGNGVDCTSAVQAAANACAAAGGGIVSYDPHNGSGVYRHGEVWFGPNTTIDGNGSTITAVDYGVFMFGSGTSQGYGGYTRNITIRNITFKGSFTANTDACLWFHHTENVLVENCVWLEANTRAHCFDLGGVKDFTIRKCQFLGRKDTNEYAEAIQLDHSTAAGLSDRETNRSTYDGLPCVNVTVEDCVFLPLKIGSTTYSAPLPLGNHVNCGTPHKGVRFVGCTVRDAYYTTALAESRGWIHTPGISDLTVESNVFESTTGQTTPVVRIYTLKTGLSDFQNPNATATAGGAVPSLSQGVRIAGNTFKGFKNGNLYALILLVGADTKRIQDVVITGNTFTDCYPDAAITAPVNDGPDCIKLDQVDQATVQANTFRNVRRILYCDRSAGVTVQANVGNGVWWYPIYFDKNGVARASVVGNIITGYCQSIFIDTVITSTVTGNQLSGPIAPASGNPGTAVIRIYGGSNASVVGNSLISPGAPSTQVPQAVIFSSAVTGGVYGSNLYAGHTKEATVSTDSTITAK